MSLDTLSVAKTTATKIKKGAKGRKSAQSKSSARGSYNPGNGNHPDDNLFDNQIQPGEYEINLDDE